MTNQKKNVQEGGNEPIAQNRNLHFPSHCEREGCCWALVPPRNPIMGINRNGFLPVVQKHLCVLVHWTDGFFIP